MRKTKTLLIGCLLAVAFISVAATTHPPGNSLIEKHYCELKIEKSIISEFQKQPINASFDVVEKESVSADIFFVSAKIDAAFIPAKNESQKLREDFYHPSYYLQPCIKLPDVYNRTKKNDRFIISYRS